MLKSMTPLPPPTKGRLKCMAPIYLKATTEKN